jgi:hypothetical protein
MTCGKHLILVYSDVLFLMLTDIGIFAERTEEADSEETLESDEDGYPLLPANVLELRLSRKKAVMRQFMGAARRLYIFNITQNHVA